MNMGEKTKTKLRCPSPCGSNTLGRENYPILVDKTKSLPYSCYYESSEGCAVTEQLNLSYQTLKGLEKATKMNQGLQDI